MEKQKIFFRGFSGILETFGTDRTYKVRMETKPTFAHHDPENRARFACRLGPYAQDRAGAWFVFNCQNGWVGVDPRTARGLRSYLMERLRRRLRARAGTA